MSFNWSSLFALYLDISYLAFGFAARLLVKLEEIIVLLGYILLSVGNLASPL